MTVIDKVYKAQILLAVWGESFINNFLEFSLPTLLAPGNIPALVAAYPTKFVLLTRLSDVHVFESSLAFQKLKTICEVEFVSIRELIVFGNYSTTLTYAYDKAVRRTGDEMTNTYFIFLTSDYIMADGSMQGIMRYMDKGYSGICAGNFQVVKEDIEPILINLLDKESHTLSVKPRDLVKCGLRYLHTVSVASIVDQGIVHNYKANRFFASASSEMMAGRFYLLHMLCIKPEVTNYQVGASCDYSFIPEMCPSGNVAIIDDSDDYFVFEAQPRSHELDYIEWGPYKSKKLVQALREWTTVRHRENANTTIFYHTHDLTAADKQAANAKLDVFFKEITPFLQSYAPQPYFNHPYWQGAVKNFDFERHALSNYPDHAFVNYMDIMNPTAARKLFYKIFGMPPHVYYWHFRRAEYQHIINEIQNFIGDNDTAETVVLYSAYTLDFMRYRYWLETHCKIKEHWQLSALVGSKPLDLNPTDRPKKCVIFVQIEKMDLLRKLLQATNSILQPNARILLILPNEQGRHASFSYNFLTEFSARINSILHNRSRLTKLKPIYSNFTGLGALVLDRINRFYSYSKKRRMLLYVLLGVPGSVLVTFYNFLFGMRQKRGYCSTLVANLVVNEENGLQNDGG